MRITADTLFLAVSAFLNSVEISAGVSPKTRDLLSNFGMSNENSNEQAVKTYSPDRSTSPAESPPRARSRSPGSRDRYIIAPPTTIDSSDGIGYNLDQLQFIRITPYRNSHRRIFELRRYTFPVDKGIQLLTRRNLFVPIPTQEQIVLSTSDGDVYAILESRSVFAGIYTRKYYKGRAKINMESGMIESVTSVERSEIPVGPSHRILMNFKVEREHVNQNPPQH